jgi:hypothetical protein
VQRADDNEQVVLERLKVYERATKPLVDFYRDRRRFRSVNGAQCRDGCARARHGDRRCAALVGAREAAPAAQESRIGESAAA